MPDKIRYLGSVQVVSNPHYPPSYIQKMTLRVPTAKPRIVVHTTETPPGTGRRIIEQERWIYHIVVEVDRIRDDGTLEAYAVLPLDKPAFSLYHKPGGVETNHMGHCIQISLVWYAARIAEIPKRVLRKLATDIIQPIMESYGVPNEWEPSHGAGEGVVLATASSPYRYTAPVWVGLNRVGYHQNVPDNDHWDPGKIDWRFMRDIIEGNPIQPAEPITIPGLERPVMYYSHPAEIKALKEILNLWFNNSFSISAEWSEPLDDAIKAAQVVLDVEPDGYWGPLTARMFLQWSRRVIDAVALGLTSDTADPAPVLRKYFQDVRELKSTRDDLREFFRKTRHNLSNEQREESLQLVHELTDNIKAIRQTRKELKALLED